MHYRQPSPPFPPLLPNSIILGLHSNSLIPPTETKFIFLINCVVFHACSLPFPVQWTQMEEQTTHPFLVAAVL